MQQPRNTRLPGIAAIIVGLSLYAWAWAADGGAVATPAAAMLAPAQEARMLTGQAPRGKTLTKQSARTRSAKRASKSPVKLAALGTPDIGLYALQTMTDEEALKSLEQEVMLKVGKQVLASDYPDEARRWRWTGTTMIQVVVGKEGTVKNVALSRSSGFRVLDESALSVVKRVSKLFVPFQLRGREHAVTVPIGFYLRGL
jgi:TonB family protein